MLLRAEMDLERQNGNVDTDINQDHWFCPPEITAGNCGPLSFEIEVDSDFPLVTLVSMLGPSPDWFVGTDGLSLRNESGTVWKNEIVADMIPYDGGTRSANVFALFGPQNDPPEPISYITEASGQIITPQSLGSMTFTRVSPRGDFGDGIYDCSDIDMIVAAVASSSTDLSFDLNGDGSVDHGDITTWLAEAGAANLASGNPYLPGDANLDGVVDVGDFNVWNANKFSMSAAWCAGDLNADGVIDVTDFNVWNSNKFSSSDASGSTVPEPSTLILAFLGLAFCGMRMR